jgi:hypothetical protein
MGLESTLCKWIIAKSSVLWLGIERWPETVFRKDCGKQVMKIYTSVKRLLRAHVVISILCLSLLKKFCQTHSSEIGFYIVVTLGSVALNFLLKNSRHFGMVENSTTMGRRIYSPFSASVGRNCYHVLGQCRLRVKHIWWPVSMLPENKKTFQQIIWSIALSPCPPSAS